MCNSVSPHIQTASKTRKKTQTATPLLFPMPVLTQVFKTNLIKVFNGADPKKQIREDQSMEDLTQQTLTNHDFCSSNIKPEAGADVWVPGWHKQEQEEKPGAVPPLLAAQMDFNCDPSPLCASHGSGRELQITDSNLCGKLPTDIPFHFFDMIFLWLRTAFARKAININLTRQQFFRKQRKEKGNSAWKCISQPKKQAGRGYLLCWSNCHWVVIKAQKTLPLIQREAVKIAYSQSIQAVLQKPLTWKGEICQCSHCCKTTGWFCKVFANEFLITAGDHSLN